LGPPSGKEERALSVVAVAFDNDRVSSSALS
jgi:hypothetical protein